MPLASSVSEEPQASPIVATLDAPIERGRDLVWCASLDLAWREVCALVGGPLELLDDASIDLARLVRALNNSPVSPGDVDPRSCVALAGPDSEEWVRVVHRRLRDQFGAALDARLLQAPHDPAQLIAYAYLAKQWSFATPFARVLEEAHFAGTPVEYFSLGAPYFTERFLERAKQVLVHHHRFVSDEEYALPDSDEVDDQAADCEAHFPAQEFVVELLTEDESDRIVLARAAPLTTLGGMVAWTISRLREDAAAAPDAHPKRLETLYVPCIDFDLTCHHHELYGLPIANAGFEGRRLGAVTERVRFRLDEGGATLVSESEVRGLALPPRELIFDGPFLLLVVRRGAKTPQLAMWIETPGLLLKRTSSASAT